jgi:hypothetical protein
MPGSLPKQQFSALELQTYAARSYNSLFNFVQGIEKFPAAYSASPVAEFGYWGRRDLDATRSITSRMMIHDRSTSSAAKCSLRRLSEKSIEPFQSDPARIPSYLAP